MMETELNNSAASEIDKLRELVKSQSELIFELERDIAYTKSLLEQASGAM